MMEPSSDGIPALPLSSLRLLVPPVRLLSAFAWQVVQQHRVLHYDKLADFVALVTETVPEVLGPGRKAELILGLRARLIMELCKAEEPDNLHRIHHNLERIRACSAELDSSPQEGGPKSLASSYGSFSQLVGTLLKDPSQKEYFLKEVVPVSYGPAYDRTLRRLVSEFLSRLEQLLPTPTLTQAAAWLTCGPPAAQEFSRSLSDPGALQALLLHHRGPGALTRGSPHDEDASAIAAALALPPAAAATATVRPAEGPGVGLCSQDGSARPSDEWRLTQPSGDIRPQRPQETQPSLKLVKIHLHKISPPLFPPTTEPEGQRAHKARGQPQSRRAEEGTPRRQENLEGAEPTATSALTGERRRRRRKGVEEEERQEHEDRAEDDKERAEERADPGRAGDRRFLSARPANPHYAEEETRCPHCGKRFQLPNQLKTHLKLHALPYCCLPCEKGFSSKSGYYQHQRLHKAGRAFPCTHCPLSFLCRYSLRQHERTHANGPAHLCPECGKRFSKVSMVRHMRMHAGRRDFLCTACGKAFLSSGELLLHTRTHTRDTPYTCMHCGKGFTTKSHLTVHSRSHTGERPYPCAACPKRFLTVSCLKRHTLSHDGVRPFRCPRCPKEFSQTGNLKKHMSTHSLPP